ncbi:hypothetical protein D3C84_939480 [compost metagenome]
MLLSACADSKYDIDKGTINGDVINIHGKITNLDRFKSFLKNVDNHVESELRIMQMTIEGDPIYYDFDYKKEKIYYAYDNRADQHGSKKKLKTECTRVISEKVERGVSYTLDGCKDTEIGRTFSFVVAE